MLLLEAKRNHEKGIIYRGGNELGRSGSRNRIAKQIIVPREANLDHYLFGRSIKMLLVLLFFLLFFLVACETFL